MPAREEEILNKILEIVKKQLDPDIIILFGSRGKQTAQGNADFDLAVSGINREQVSVRCHRKIMEKIDRAAGLYTVDLVYLDSVEEQFKDIILETGRVIYERNRS